MMQVRHTYRSIVMLIALLSACKGKEPTPKSQELPDLNVQIRSYVTVENTKVRTGPGTQFSTIAEIRQNSMVQVVGRDGEWVLIVSQKGNGPGYIETASVKPGTGEGQESSTPPGKYEPFVDTQVRSGPGLEHSVVARIKKGTKLNVVNEENGWLKVESKSGKPPGYVDASLVRPANQQSGERRRS